ncbi:MAG: ATP-binding protein [Candidatus Competibacteraceae bacterium]|nr:ATP-binding protein [Candidatus Competibacteraceae bacterium]
MAFHKAIRKQAKLRLALSGPSGSGKTYSALLIAQGLAPDGRIALIDTERGSGELYAHLADYDIATLTPPYTPDRYIRLIQDAEQAGYQVLIIDSLSHAWTGQGGVLDMHEKAATAARGNTWAAWREVTPQHNALVDAMLGSNLHLIATLRTKTAYDVTEENGKKKPVKVGLAPVQREGMEYEFSVLLDLTVDSHIATAAKDRTSLFDGQHFTPTPETGVKLRDWLDSGVDPVAASQTLLDALKVRVCEMDNVPHLENWWRAHQGEIVTLLPVDQERLKAHCAIRKAAILEGLKTESPPKAPRSKARSKGNGADAATPATLTPPLEQEAA